MKQITQQILELYSHDYSTNVSDDPGQKINKSKKSLGNICHTYQITHAFHHSKNEEQKNHIYPSH